MRTLGDYETFCVVMDWQRAKEFIAKKIAEQGRGEAVIQDEGQMIHFLAMLEQKVAAGEEGNT